MACLNLYKVLENKEIQICPDVIETPTAKIANPTEEIAHQFGYWPLEETPPPAKKEGVKVIDCRYEYADLPDGTKKVIHVWKELIIVDEKPNVAEDSAIVEDHWEIQDDKYVHIYNVRRIVDNPPELGPNQFVKSVHWYDDGSARTAIYDVWTDISDECPEEQEGYRCVVTDTIDDAAAKTRKKIFKMKKIVDVPPADDPNGTFYWVRGEEVETEDSIIVNYHQVLKQWRIFSKLKLEMLAFKMGFLSKLDQFLATETLTNGSGDRVSLKRFYDQANELYEKHELFQPYYTRILNILGFTVEEGEEILKQIVADKTPVIATPKI